MIVFDKNGVAKLMLNSMGNGHLVTRCEIDIRHMEGDTLTVEVECSQPLGVVIGDYVEVEGSRYRMNQVPAIEKLAEDRMIYTLVFESAKYDLANVVLIMPSSTIGDMLTANLRQFVQLVVDNANRVYPGQWVLGSVPTVSDTKTRQFSEQSALAALQSICEEYDYEFRIQERGNQKTIDLMQDGNVSGLKFQYGAGLGLYSITRLATASEDVVTRLYAYGSTDNLNIGYRHTRLCLPDLAKEASYIEDPSRVALFGIKEGIFIDDDIKPHCRATVTGIPQPTSAANVNQFYCSSFDTALPYGFDLEARWVLADYGEYLVIRGYSDSQSTYDYFAKHIVGTYKYLIDRAKITFNSGKLMGYSFDVHSYDANTHLFELVTIIENEGTANEQKIPSADSTTYRISVGDEFVITDISLPYPLVQRAEHELLTKAREYYNEHSEVCARYQIELDPIYMSRYLPTGGSLRVGDYVRIYDADLGINKNIKVFRIFRDLISETWSIEISDIQKVESANRYTNDSLAALDIDSDLPITNLTSTFTPNYQGNVNALHVGAGLFVSNRFTGSSQSWTVYERTITDLNADTAYYLYLRAYRRSNFRYADITLAPLFPPSSDELAAGALFPKPSRLPQSEEYYYLNIGTLSKVTGTRLLRKRTLTLIYGHVQLSGNDITGGLIVGHDGSTIINLDQNIIQGDLYFRKDNELVPVSDLSTQIDLKADAKEVEKLSADIKNIDTAIKGGTGGTKQYDTLSQFPTIGDHRFTYVDKSTGRSYAWNDTEGKEGYYCIGSDYKRVEFVRSSI